MAAPPGGAFPPPPPPASASAVRRYGEQHRNSSSTSNSRPPGPPPPPFHPPGAATTAVPRAAPGPPPLPPRPPPSAFYSRPPQQQQAHHPHPRHDPRPHGLLHAGMPHLAHGPTHALAPRPFEQQPAASVDMRGPPDDARGEQRVHQYQHQHQHQDQGQRQASDRLSVREESKQQEEVEELLSNARARLSRNEPEMDVHTRAYIPFFNAREVAAMLAEQAGGSSEALQAQRTRTAAACGFVAALGARMGFPQRTTCTAQLLFQRFHLFFPMRDFVPHEVSLAALALAAKVNDTYKRGRDVLLASYAIRFPQLVNTKLEAPLASGGIRHVAESDVDAKALEAERKKLHALEKLFLESICFNFHATASSALTLVVKLARLWRIDKEASATAWCVASDAHRTSAVLCYPSNIIAAASLYLAQEILLAASDYCGNLSSLDAARLQPQMDELLSQMRSNYHALAAETDAPSHSATLPNGSTSEQEDKGKEQRLLHLDMQSIHETVRSILDLYHDSAVAIKTTFGSLFNISPRSPFDLQPFLPSSDALDGTGAPSLAAQSGAKKVADSKWGSAPPPLMICWLAERFVQAGKGSGDIVTMFEDLKIKALQRAPDFFSPRQPGQQPQRTGTREGKEADGSKADETQDKNDDDNDNNDNEETQRRARLRRRMDEAREAVRPLPFIGKQQLKAARDAAAYATASAAAAAALAGTPEANEANALVKALSADKKMSLKRYWFEVE